MRPCPFTVSLEEAWGSNHKRFLGISNMLLPCKEYPGGSSFRPSATLLNALSTLSRAPASCRLQNPSLAAHSPQPTRGFPALSALCPPTGEPQQNRLQSCLTLEPDGTPEPCAQGRGRAEQARSGSSSGRPGEWGRVHDLPTCLCHSTEISPSPVDSGEPGVGLSWRGKQPDP